MSLKKHARAPLYNPKNPKSLTTVKARTLAPPAISPATCKRILTISKGFVNTTCDAPAWNKNTFNFKIYEGVPKNRMRLIWAKRSYYAVLPLEKVAPGL